MELSLGNSLVRKVLSHESFSWIHGDGIAAVLRSLLHTIIIVFWINFRASRAFKLHSTWSFASHIGMTRLPASLRLISFVSLFHFGSLVLLFLSQSLLGNDLVSIRNVHRLENGAIDWYRLSESLIGSPIREELVFRAVLANVFYSRTEGLNPRTRFLYQCYGPAALFGAVHLLNFASASRAGYPLSYVSAQVTLGVLLGLFFCLSFVRSNTVLEPIILHFINNLSAMFVSRSDKFDLSNPWLFVPLSITFAFYSHFVKMIWNELYDSVSGEVDNFSDLIKARSHLKALQSDLESASARERVRLSKQFEEAIESLYSQLTPDAAGESRFRNQAVHALIHQFKTHQA
jgi:membrane protease YdiL (CAAX protease family)